MNFKLARLIAIAFGCATLIDQTGSGQTEFVSKEFREFEDLREIEDFRELLAKPSQIASWKTNGVCVFYPPLSPRERIRDKPGVEVAVTKGMSILNVVAAVYGGDFPGVHQVRLFGRNRIVQIQLRQKGERLDLENEGDRTCAVVEPGDIVVMQLRR